MNRLLTCNGSWRTFCRLPLHLYRGSMAKEFFEVFPTIKTRGELRDLFQETMVTRLAYNKDHTRLRIYLDSRHLIHNKYIRQMENLLTLEVCGGTPVQAVLIEHYSLSEQYNPKMLMHEYYDSLTAEFWHRSPILGSFFKEASFDYPENTENSKDSTGTDNQDGPKDADNLEASRGSKGGDNLDVLSNQKEDRVVVHLENSGMAREEGKVIQSSLTTIFRERCDMDCSFQIVCDLPVRHRAKAVLDDELPAGNRGGLAAGGSAEQANDGMHNGMHADGGTMLKARQAGEDALQRASAAGTAPPSGNSMAAGSGSASGVAKEAKAAAPAGGAFDGRNAKGGRGNAGFGKSGGDKAMRSFIRSNRPEVICGRDFDDDAIPISDIIGEMGEVTIRGKITSNERRDIRNEKSILKFTITDFTDSIAVKIFAPTIYAEQTMNRLKPGSFVKVKGFTKEDTFEHEVTVSSPVGIMEIPSFVTKRKDRYEKKRVELHMHTKMSDMDGVSECKDLVKRAYEWGWPAVAITDHGNVQAFPDANHQIEALYKDHCKARKAAGEKPDDIQDFFKVIYGVECYLVDDLKKMVMFGNPAEDPAFARISGEMADGTEGILPAENSSDTGAKDYEDYRIETGNYVIFDIETTGFSSERDRIIEIGAVRYEQGKKTGDFSEFVNPKIPIPFRITRLTSITDEMVLPAKTIDDVLPRFLEFCKGCVLVGHNVGFDISFIRKNAKDLGLPCPHTTIDTVGMARVMLPGHKSYNLDAVGKLLNVVNPHHHRAVDDAATTAEIFIKLLNMFTQKGVTTLGGMNALADQDPDVIRRLRPVHCILLAKNVTGRTNLYRLISESHLTYFYQKPKIPKTLLTKYREGLIVGSACVMGELYQAILDEKSEETLAGIVDFYDYLEIQPRENNEFLIASERHENIRSMEDILDINRRIVRLGEQYGKPVVATGDVHFLDPEDEVYRSIVQDSMGMNQEEKPAPLYLRTTDEMMEEFSYLGNAKCEEVVITNPNRIASWVDAMSPVRPDKCPPVIENSDEQLREICYRQAHKMYGDPLPKVVGDRLERELTSIIKNGYSVMYIIAQKLVWKSNEDGYLVGSRGSVGSSFVATMSGITEVNPLAPHYYCEECHYSDFESEEVRAYAGRCGVDMPVKMCPNCGKELVRAGFDIPFETFLGFKGDKEPDIDLNFSGEYQSKAHAYTKVIFGHEQTFKAGTIATVADKTAYGYTLGYCEHRNIVKRRAEMERLAAGCVGVRRSTGQHPGGIVVLPIGEEINTFTPVQHPANDMTTNIITTHFDYHSIDHNLLKLDILGHDDPTMIRMLQDITGVNPIELPLDDPGVMQLFTGLESLKITSEQDGGIKVGTLGVPEFGTKFVMGMLQDTKPTTLSELIKISGLSHGTDVWLGNASDLIAQGICTLSTCIGCRDDIMTYLINMGEEPSVAFKTMESVRKGKGLQPEMEEAMRAAGVPEWYHDACLKIKYMFPKGHAAAYVMMALRIAWFKVHEPLAYYCAYYTIRAKAFDYEMMAQGQQHLLDCMQEYRSRDKLTAAEEAQMDDALVVREMYARGIEFTPIQLGVAKGRNFQIVDGKIMPAYTSLHGMGANAADALEEACKGGPFVSQQDIRERAKVSQTILEKMSELGLLGELPESNQFSIFDLM